LSETVKVGDVEARPGSKAKGLVKVAETSGFELRLPVHIVNGRNPGPTLAIIAGIHPVEHPPMEGTIRLAKELDPEKLKGTLITVPVFNIPGFQAREPGAPLERTPLTSAFPGDPEGSPNERAAHFIATEVLQKADYVMETHGCNYQETCPNHVLGARWGDDELDKAILMMARCFETDYIRGVMEHQVREPRERGHGVREQAAKMKIPAIGQEVGSAGGISSETGKLCEMDIMWFMDGVKNFMRKVGMLEGEARLYDPWAVKNVLHFRAKSAGWFYPMKPNGAKASKDEVICEIRDFFGEIKQQLKAPVDGIISLIWTRPAVDQGSILLQMFELGPKVSTLFT